MRLPAFTLFPLLLLSMSAYTWDDTGHRTTAAIAFDALSADARDVIVGVLHEHPRFAEDFQNLMPTDIAAGSQHARNKWLLTQAAVWPDLIQGLDGTVRDKYNRSRWHYINLVIYLADDDAQKLDGVLQHNMETGFAPPLRQNLNSIQALRGNLAVWRDRRASQAERAIALCWILHLAGDMHQPLHNVALFSAPYFPNGDRGGNSIDVTWGNEVRNLHAVWDGMATVMDDLTPSARTLRTIENDVVDDQAIEVWLHHHARLAELFVYPENIKAQIEARLAREETPQITLSHEYLVRARSVTRRQINLAGNRMARLLAEK